MQISRRQVIDAIQFFFLPYRWYPLLLLHQLYGKYFVYLTDKTINTVRILLSWANRNSCLVNRVNNKNASPFTRIRAAFTISSKNNRQIIRIEANRLADRDSPSINNIISYYIMTCCKTKLAAILCGSNKSQWNGNERIKLSARYCCVSFPFLIRL